MPPMDTSTVDAPAFDWQGKFADVPSDMLRCGDRLSDGAVKALVLCYALVRLQNPPPDDPCGPDDSAEHFMTPRGGWGVALGCEERTARRWRGELVKVGIIDALGPAWAGGRAIFAFRQHDISTRRRVPLDRWAELSPDLARTFAVLCTYAGRDSNRAWPRRETLARDLGLSSPDTVTARMRRLAAAGMVHARRRRRGSVLYTILETRFRSGGRTQTAFQDEANTKGADSNRASRGTETAHGGDRNRVSGGTETAPEQESLNESPEREGRNDSGSPSANERPSADGEPPDHPRFSTAEVRSIVRETLKSSGLRPRKKTQREITAEGLAVLRDGLTRR